MIHRPTDKRIAEMIFVINWLIASFLNGAFFFGLFVLLLYWFYLKDLPVQKPPVQPQFVVFSMANVSRLQMLRLGFVVVVKV